MNHYGIILRKLRELNLFTVKQAAKKIGRSSGWISQIENGKGLVRLDQVEFERIVTAYNGESYRKQFGAWISRSKIKESAVDGPYRRHSLQFIPETSFTLFASQKDRLPVQL